MSQGAGAQQQVRELRLQAPIEPFTLVMELDTWNIRERNDENWGKPRSCVRKVKNLRGGTGFMAGPVFD